MKARTQAIPNVRLRQQREQRHWTQTELARLIDATYVTVCRWESGATVPSLYHRQKLCAVFGLPAEALGLSGAPEEPPAAGGGHAAPASAEVWQVPYRRNPFFTGREAVLARLATLLSAGKAAALSQVQALSGLGGIGKTQTAVEYAYRHRHDYQAVFWARAETRDTLQADLAQAADLLDLPERQERDQRRILAAVQRWLRTHERWLLILDNVEDLALVEEILPAGAPGHLLLTTRASALGGVAQRLDLEEMTPAEGGLLLLRRAGVLAPDAPLEASAHARVAREISRQLSGLPLALDQAGAYIEETGGSPAEYLERFQHHQATLLRRRGRSREHPEPVSTTVALAFQNVQRASPAAADLLRLCAFLAADAIPEELITTGAADLGETLAPVAADPLALDEVYVVLRRSSLVRRHAESQTLTIHRLVQAVLRAEMDETTRRLWAGRAVRAICVTFPQASYENWSTCGRLLPHALVCAACIDHYRFVTPEAGLVLYRAACYLRDSARYQQAEPLLQRALTTREQALGAEHLDTIETCSELAGLYSDQGRYAEAEPLFLAVLATRERVLGSDHLEVARVLSYASKLYSRLGNYAQAEAFNLRALAIREQQLGPDHLSLSLNLNNLGFLYFVQGKYEQAEPLFWRALAIRERELGPEHPHLGAPLSNLAKIYKARGDYTQAEALLLRALANYDQQFGAAHPFTVQALADLAELYRAQGQYAQAEDLHKRVLTTREQMLGVEHPDLADSLYCLAELYYDQGRYAEAKPLFLRALTIYEQALGADHPETVVIRERLARLQEQVESSENKPERQEARTQGNPFPDASL